MIGTLVASPPGRGGNDVKCDKRDMENVDALRAQLEGLARRAASAEGVDVAWLELRGQGSSRMLRVFIERSEGEVGIDDCERVGERLSLLLDVEDPIDSAYTLEVSSPGLDRPLHNANDYERFAGRLARVKTKELVGGKKVFIGRLRGVDSDAVLLEDQGTTVSLPLTLIDSGRLEVELEPSPRKARKRA